MGECRCNWLLDSRCRAASDGPANYRSVEKPFNSDVKVGAVRAVLRCVHFASCVPSDCTNMEIAGRKIREWHYDESRDAAVCANSREWATLLDPVVGKCPTVRIFLAEGLSSEGGKEELIIGRSWRLRWAGADGAARTAAPNVDVYFMCLSLAKTQMQAWPRPIRSWPRRAQSRSRGYSRPRRRRGGSPSPRWGRRRFAAGSRRSPRWDRRR